MASRSSVGYSKVSLPSYPFERSVFKVTPLEKSDFQRNRSASGSFDFDPMFTTLQKSHQDEFLLSPSDVFLSEHRIFGVPVLPGVMYLELIARSFRKLLRQQIYRFSEIKWMAPLKCKQDVKLKVSFSKSDNTGYWIEVFSELNGLKTVHLNGYADTNPSEVVDNSDSYHRLIDNSQSCSVQKEDFYQVFDRTDFSYGSLYKSVKSVSFSDSSASADVHIPDSNSSDLNGYVLHPSIFDGCLQIAGWLANFSILERRTTYIPAGFESMSIYSSVPSELHILVKNSTDNMTIESKSKSFDLLLLDYGGKPIAEILGYRLLESVDSNERLQQGIAFRWKHFEVSPSTIYQGACAILLTGGDIGNISQLVGISEPFIKKTDESNDVFGMRLASSLLANKLNRVCFLLGSTSDLGLQVDSAISVVEIIRAMLSANPNVVFSFTAVWRTLDRGGEPGYSSLSAFGKSLCREFPSLDFKTISLSSWDEFKYVITLAGLRKGVCNRFKVEDGISFKEILCEIRFPVNERLKAFRERGVYIVTGGTGGIGFQIAQNILKNSACTVIIIGRRQPKDILQKQIDSLNVGAVRCIFHKCDVANIDEFFAALVEIEGRFRTITGILHFAGSIDDGGLLNRDVLPIPSEVFAKVFGLVAIAKFLETRKIDFVVSSSSITSVLGSAGQTSYAMANGFLDCFSELDDSKYCKNKFISINLPYWRSGGMKMTTTQSELLESQLSITSISTSQGLNFIADVINSNEKRVMAVGVDVAGFLSKYEIADKEIENSKHSSKVDYNDLMPIDLPASLLILLSRILGHPIDSIEKSVPLQRYGIDSISLAEFCRSMESELGIKITPVQLLVIEPLTLDNIVQLVSKSYYARLDVQNQEISQNQAHLTVPDLPKTSIRFDDNVDTVVVRAISKVTGRSQNRINLDDNLSSYGLNSINLAELSKQIKLSLNRNISLLPLLELQSPTVANLVDLVRLNKYANGHSPKMVINSTANDRANFQVLKPSEFTENLDGNEAPNDNDIVIAGLHSFLPQVKSIEDFWELVSEGECTISKISQARSSKLSTSSDTDQIISTSSGSFLTDIDLFDPSFFGIGHEDACFLDPQVRLLLRSVWHVFEDAGLPPLQFAGTNTGVFVGVGGIEYNEIIQSVKGMSGLAKGIGNANFWVSNRVSHYFNFKGPSVSIDTSCSSSSTALHSAIQSIITRDCTAAVVGGCNLQLSLQRMANYSSLGVLSEKGTMNPYESDVDGFLRGDGVLSVLLMPFHLAKQLNVTGYAIIKGSAINHSGERLTVTSSGIEAQKAAMAGALKRAGKRINDLIYVEGHGASTVIGDTAELAALEGIFSENGIQGNTPFCKKIPIGSVKENFANLEAASGLASVIKCALMIKNAAIPPSASAKKGRQDIEVGSGLFYKPCQKLDLYNAAKGKSIISVNCYGAGGANAHFVLSPINSGYLNEAVSDQAEQSYIFVFSAHTEVALVSLLDKYCSFIEQLQEDKIRILASSLFYKRQQMSVRYAFISNSLSDLGRQIRATVNEMRNSSNMPDLALRTSSTNKQGDYNDYLLELLVDWVNGNPERLTEHFRKRNTTPIAQIKLPLYPFELVSCWVELFDNSNDSLSVSLMNSDKNTAVSFPIDEIDDWHNGKLEDIELILLDLAREILFQGRPSNSTVTLDALRNLDSISITRFKYRIHQMTRVSIPIKVILSSNDFNELASHIYVLSKTAVFESAIEEPNTNSNELISTEDSGTAQIQIAINELTDSELDELYNKVKAQSTI
jgi:acyl transferase domain-containing protein/acyl carrier protein/aryl carrier-like protein